MYLHSRRDIDSRNKRGSIIVKEFVTKTFERSRKAYEGLFLVAQLDLVDFGKVLFDETS